MIQISDVTKSFARKTAVSNINFEVQPGRIVGFIGPNGAGKTTIMRSAVGLVKPDFGQVTFKGVRYQELKAPLRTVGCMLDTKMLPRDITAANLLTYCALTQGLSKSAVSNVLDEVGLTESADKRVGGFSLGMMQRLGLAIALLGDPSYYLLDEPLNGLDPSGILWLRNKLLELKQRGAAILLSSHLMSELSFVADDVVIINKGKIVLRSSIDELNQQAVPRVHVESNNNKLLMNHLIEAQVSEINHEAGELVVQGLSPETIFRHAVRHGLELRSLYAESLSLDQVYKTLVEQDLHESGDE